MAATVPRHGPHRLLPRPPLLRWVRASRQTDRQTRRAGSQSGRPSTPHPSIYPLTPTPTPTHPGGTGYYASPLSFIRNPLLWLHMLSTYRGTHTQARRPARHVGGSCGSPACMSAFDTYNVHTSTQAPNFAYALAAKKYLAAPDPKVSHPFFVGVLVSGGFAPSHPHPPHTVRTSTLSTSRACGT